MNSLLKKILNGIFGLTFILLLSSCEKSPEPISYGNDACDNCRMTISDPKFGAELITDKGKIYKFDSAECLVAFEKEFKQEEINSGWVTNFSVAGEFIKTEDAFYLVSDKIKSPMGLNISAYSNKKSLEETHSKFDGKILNWKDVQAYVQNEWK